MCLKFYSFALKIVASDYFQTSIRFYQSTLRLIPGHSTYYYKFILTYETPKLHKM